MGLLKLFVTVKREKQLKFLCQALWNNEDRFWWSEHYLHYIKNNHINYKHLYDINVDIMS